MPPECEACVGGNEIDKRKLQQGTGCRCPVPLILAAIVPECSAAADSLPALNPGALSSHVSLCPHTADTAVSCLPWEQNMPIFLQHRLAMLQIAGTFLDCSQRSVVTGLLL